MLGFDLMWDPAYYEDVDLCLKLRLLGLSTVYCPHATVTHIEHATSSGPDHGLQLNNIVAINREKFVARWGNFLRTSEEKPDLVPFSPAVPLPEPAGKPRVAIYTPYNITPGGGERNYLTIAEALRGIAEVVLVTPFPFSRTRIFDMGLGEFGLELDHISLQQPAQSKDKSGPQFDLAFVLGNHIYPPIPHLGERNIYICQFPFPVSGEVSERERRSLWNDYDLILTYSSFVSKHVNRMDCISCPAVACGGRSFRRRCRCCRSRWRSVCKSCMSDGFLPEDTASARIF